MTQHIVRKDPRLLRGLQCFEAVARCGSMTDAALELSITPSAVSHQLRILSDILGEKLLEKKGRGVALTAAGRRLATMLHATFSDIETSVAELIGETRPVVRLAVCSSFGPAWLAPKMPELFEKFPGLGVELKLYAGQPQQTHESADAIVTAQPVEPGYDALTLFEERVVAVARPTPDGRVPSSGHRYIATIQPPLDPMDEWAGYARATGLNISAADRSDSIVCTHYILALELARAGCGVALVPEFLAERSLRDQSLVLLHDIAVPSGRTYRYCTKKSRADDASLRHLGRWLRAQAQRPDVPVVPWQPVTVTT